MKKFIGKFAFIAALVCLSSLAACGTQKSEKQVDVAYTVGTYSGYRVDLVQILGVEAAAVIVDYEVGGIYINSLPDPSWKYVVWTGEDEYLVLTAAYEQGLVTMSDIIEISKEEGAYALIYTAHTVGTFSGYRVAVENTLPEGVLVPCVEVDYFAPSWEYVVEESDDERIYLTDAYLIGIISRADLLAIAAAEAEYYSAQK